MTNTKTALMTRKRYFIVFLLFVTGVINYLDRTNMSIAAPQMLIDLKINKIQLGYIFASWGYAYTAFQIPCGWLVDKVKPKYFIAGILFCWSLATFALGLSGIFFIIVGLRFIIGMFEAPSYPTNNKIVTAWVPEKERASSIAIYTAAQYVGVAFLAPLLGWIIKTYSWHAIFFVTGGLGIIWSIIWLWKYNDPKEFPGVSDAELELIKKGGGTVDAKIEDNDIPTDQSVLKDLIFIFTRKKLLGLFFGQFCKGGAGIFFLTWFPTYLVTYLHMSFIKAGFAASIPFLCGFAGVLCSGFFSDFLVRKGYSLSLARKTPIIAGFALTAVILGAAMTDSNKIIIVCMSIAFFATGLSAITWSLVSSVAPKRLIGLTGGSFNFVGGLSSVIIPIAIGHLASIDNTGFLYPLLLVAALGLIGIFCYTVLLGKVERIADYK